MPKYIVYVSHTFDDSIEVEADSYDDALDMGEDKLRGVWQVSHSLDPKHIPLMWNSIEAYDADEVEEM